MNVFNELIDSFQAQSEALSNEAKSKLVLSNKGDIGGERENILADFLKKHLPSRCGLVKGGYIFDSEGLQSKQIDLIVTNDLALQFKQSVNPGLQKSLATVEGCYAALSIKSILDMDGLTDSIENLQSIPLENKKIKPNPQVKDIQEFVKAMPLTIVFAYTGVTLDTFKDYVLSYKSSNASLEKFPDMIIVNNSYFGWKAGMEDINDAYGRKLSPNSLWIEHTSNKIGGLGLIHMLTKIQRLANIGPQILTNFEIYLNAISDALKVSGQWPRNDALLGYTE